MTDIGEPIENPGIEILPVEVPVPQEVPELVPVECLKIKGGPAVSKTDSHVAPYPGDECRCGIYGVKEVEQCKHWARDAGFPEGLVAIGEIELWGRIWQCKKGVRGQFARPKWIRLLLPVPTDIDVEEVVIELIQLYSVPIHAASPPWELH